MSNEEIEIYNLLTDDNIPPREFNNIMYGVIGTRMFSVDFNIIENVIRIIQTSNLLEKVILLMDYAKGAYSYNVPFETQLEILTYLWNALSISIETKFEIIRKIKDLLDYSITRNNHGVYTKSNDILYKKNIVRINFLIELYNAEIDELRVAISGIGPNGLVGRLVLQNRFILPKLSRYNPTFPQPPNTSFGKKLKRKKN